MLYSSKSPLKKKRGGGGFEENKDFGLPKPLQNSVKVGLQSNVVAHSMQMKMLISTRSN